MKKRKMTMLLAATMIISSLTACGGREGNASSNPGSAEQTKEKEVSAQEVTEIEFWYGFGGQQAELLESVIADFNALQDEVVVTGVAHSSYSEVAQMLQAAIASGDMPACFFSDPVTCAKYAEKGVVQYLDDYIAADPDIDMEDIIDVFLDYCKDEEGRIYSFPVWGSTQVIYYRKDMFEEAGLDPDEVFATWQNVAEAARVLQERYKDVPGFYGFEPMYGADCLNEMAYSNGAAVLSEDKRTVTFNSDAYVEALEAARVWINEEKIMGIHFGGDGWEYWYKTIDDVMQGRAGGYLGSSGDQGDLDFDIIAAHVQPGFNEHAPMPYADAHMVAIMKKVPEEQKKAAYQWLAYLNKVGGMKFSMATGYVPVRRSVRENEEYKAYLEENPQALIPLEQAEISRVQWQDVTGGKISDALADACDLIEIENVPAKEALDEAAAIAQQALDEYWAEQGE